MTTPPRHEQVQCLSPAGLHTLRWVEWGAADNPKVLVCVHGLTRTGRDFDTLAQALCGDYRVVCPDMAGRGQSDWLRDPVHYSIPQYLADMVTLVARLQADTLHWLGTSMGGLIGLAYAALANTPIQKLILNDVGPLLAAPALKRIGDYLGQPQHFENFDQAVTYIRTVSAAFGNFSDAQWRELTEHVVVPDGKGWKLHYDPGIALGFQHSAAQGDISLWHLYEQIRCPVLVIRGEHSDLLSRTTHAEMGTRGPQAQLVEFPNCGHAPMFMDEAQIKVVQAFLARPGG